MDERRLTWSSTDVVESELRDAWVELEEEGEWLSDSTSGTENGDLGELYGIVRIASKQNIEVAPVCAEAQRELD